jgi:SP family arabinose:H+ symporter-like MFS transporter
MAQAQAGETGNSVLTTLDDRVPTAFYWQLTLLATLGGFLFGYDTSNIGSALNFVPYHLQGLALGYLVSGASLGAAAGAILAGPISDHFGRKTVLVIDAGIYATGAILSAVTPDATVLLAARTLIGLAIGADSAIATAYIAEYAPKSRRGSLSMLQQWMITVGILVSYIVALVIFAAFPNSAATVGWRLVLGLCAVPALVRMVPRSRMPASPGGCCGTAGGRTCRRPWPRWAPGPAWMTSAAPRRSSSKSRRARGAGPGRRACGGR